MIKLFSSVPKSQLSVAAAAVPLPWHQNSPSSFGYMPKTHLQKQNFQKFNSCRLRRIMAAKEEGDKDQTSVPSWAKPDSDELPPWARQEAQKDSSAGFEVPFFVYLLASAITAIAAIGSVFEYANQKPVFGVLSSDSIFYAPVLGFFALTGIPTSAYLWFKSVQVANKEAEEQDKRDGYQ